ncbi:hypothetical protein [Paractinoplanes durhamensis]|uniref:Uncharacterized protein n=1 Tax=Paractinoplanes durhamensis TaxID=113563 RepID=A0ABQ3ZC41_9ACTN|nr:hypothetical protein [Actinoplanes durhamensis]GIE07408.1 hypothetical protein Adu01nite_87580 [Actinoplanes durhamensis]
MSLAARAFGQDQGMTSLVLSPERRAQLAGLLGDERRLDAEYPRVAEYLDAAAALPGTGDTEADRLFDLWLLHYMTDGSAESGNPYWEIVAPSTAKTPSLTTALASRGPMQTRTCQERHGVAGGYAHHQHT